MSQDSKESKNYEGNVKEAFAMVETKIGLWCGEPWAVYEIRKRNFRARKTLFRENRMRGEGMCAQ